MFTAEVLNKRFSWDEDLHPRDSQGRFVRSWRELVGAFQAAFEEYEDNNLVRIPPRTVARNPERDRLVAEQERVEVALSDAEAALFTWLESDKDAAIPLPGNLARTFGGARWAQEGATHLDALERPTGPNADLAGGPFHRAFIAYSADNVRAEINTTLRASGEPGSSIRRIVEAMDEAFEAAPPTTEHLVSHRGLSMAEPPEVGDVIVDLGFSSTIGDRDEARHFAVGRSAGAGRYAKDMTDPPTGNPPLLVEILIPKGSKIITDGWETITPRGSVFEIVGRRGDGTVVAYLRPPGAVPEEIAA